MLRKSKIVARILVGGAAVYKNKITTYNKLFRYVRCVRVMKDSV